MPDVISFDQAIAKTANKSRTLLLGNGFSVKYFGYRTLLAASGLQPSDPLKALFQALDTVDFELVMRSLEEAAVVERAYKNDRQAKLFTDDAANVRAALIHAIKSTHPSHRENIEDVIPSCIQFLQQFATIFTLNYDLLLYWVTLDDTTNFKDGFGLGREWGGDFIGPWKRDAYCNVFNLHGGLHLFRTESGEIEKKLKGAAGVIEGIANTITLQKRLPLYVAEGTSSGKMKKINSTAYLRHCYDQFCSCAGEFFIYGHSAARNDEHIYNALFTSKAEHLYFCIHTPTAKIKVLDAELARYKRLNESKLDYTFVDSESAAVWNRAVPKTTSKQPAPSTSHSTL